jgi:hypothetical protein
MAVLKQADQRLADRRLAGAGFAHQRHHFTGMNPKAEIAHRRDRPAPGSERDAQALDGKQWYDAGSDSIPRLVMH